MLHYLLQLDIDTLTWARSLVWIEFARAIQLLGESVVLWWALLLLFLWFRGVKLGDNRYKVWALEIFFVIILTFVLHFLVNLGIPQWRPSPQTVVWGIAPLIPHPIDNSFPSGHALFTVALLVGLWSSYKRWWAIAGTILFGLITASARVIGGVHYPGDILGGWLFGFIGGYIALFCINTTLFRLYIFPGIIRVASWLKL